MGDGFAAARPNAAALPPGLKPDMLPPPLLPPLFVRVVVVAFSSPAAPLRCLAEAALIVVVVWAHDESDFIDSPEAVFPLLHHWKKKEPLQSVEDLRRRVRSEHFFLAS